MSDIAEVDPRRSALQRGGWRGRAGGDFGWCLGGQLQLQFVQQEVEFGFGLGVAGEQQLAAVGGRQVHVDHLQGGEFFQHAARRQPGRQRMQAPRKSDVQAIGQEGDEDVGLNTCLELVKDRQDRQVAPRLRGGRLLRFLNASSTATSNRYWLHSLAGSSSTRLVRKRYRPSRDRVCRSLLRSSR